MIKTIEDLRVLDDEIFKDFNKLVNHLPFLLKSDFKNTVEICSMFMYSSDCLKRGIFDCVKSNDTYSINVLYRSINEHFFRFKYFYFNNSSFKDDSYAFLFKTSLDFSEKMAIEKAINSAKQMKNEGIKTPKEIWDSLVSSNKDFGKFTKEDTSEFSKSLSIKNIIRYLEKKVSASETDTFLQDRIIEYSLLSSYVHGGIYAHIDSVAFGVAKDKAEQYLNIYGSTLQITTSIKIFSYLTISQFMPEFEEMYNNSLLLMRKIK
ncbi:MAG: hypothetical protein V4643_09865 [Bacteroidota bacterium]